MRARRDALRSMKRYLAHALGEEWEVRLWDERGTFKRPFARVALVGPELLSGPKQHTDVVQPVTLHVYPVEQPTIEQAISQAEEVEELLHDAFRVGVSYTDPLVEPRGLFAFEHSDGGTLAPGFYTYLVTALNPSGESVASQSVVVLAAGGRSRIALSWARVAGAHSYRVYRGPDVDGAVLIGTATTNAFEDTGLPPGVAEPPETSAATTTVSGAPMRVPLYDYAGIPDTAGSSYRDPSDFISLLDLSVNALHDPVDERLMHLVVDARCGWRRRGRVPSGTKVVDSVRITDFVET